jgi:hypothetical protein
MVLGPVMGHTSQPVTPTWVSPGAEAGGCTSSVTGTQGGPAQSTARYMSNQAGQAYNSQVSAFSDWVGIVSATGGCQQMYVRALLDAVSCL